MISDQTATTQHLTWWQRIPRRVRRSTSDREPVGTPLCADPVAERKGRRE